MATFDKAVHNWTADINEWYDINAQEDEVKKAFFKLKEYRDAKDEPDEESYKYIVNDDAEGYWKYQK